MTEEELFITDGMTWSFSRLNSFSHGCKEEWKRHYLECEPSENGFFGEYGGFIHKILEMYENGELSIFDISQYYEDNFNEAIPHNAPNNKYVDIRQSYFEKGLDYLNNIDLDLDSYEILGVEKEVRFEISGKPFIGYIDLLLKNRETGEITILDHKSASLKFLKNGNISKGDAEHYREFIRQLCLYAIPVIEEYGRVDYLEWNMFKDRKHIRIPFTKEDFDEAIKWAEDTLKEIEAEECWFPQPDSFYCWQLCSVRNAACPYKPKFTKEEE